MIQRFGFVVGKCGSARYPESDKEADEPGEAGDGIGQQRARMSGRDRVDEPVNRECDQEAECELGHGEQPVCPSDARVELVDLPTQAGEKS